MKNWKVDLVNVVLKNSLTIVLAIGLIIVGGLGYSFYKDKNAAESKLIGMTDKYNQLDKWTAELEVGYLKEQALREKAQEGWEKELKRNKDLSDQLKAVADATFSVKSFELTQDKPDLVTDKELIQEVQFVDEHGKLGPVVGYVRIENSTGKTTSKVVDHDIQVEALVTEGKDGQIEVLSKAYYVQREKTLDGSIGKEDWVDKPWAIPITGGHIFINPDKPVGSETLKPRFMTVPHINGGLFVGASELGGLESGGHADLSIFGYGKTKNDLDFKLIGVGANFSRDYMDINLVPVSYRIGNHIPIVEDMYISPGIGFGTGGRSAFIGITTTF